MNETMSYECTEINYISNLPLTYLSYLPLSYLDKVDNQIIIISRCLGIIPLNKQGRQLGCDHVVI